ncbi:MAG: hypothetical protein U1F51_13895 [Burkholderiales bacterium]
MADTPARPTIQSDADYAAALDELDRLMLVDPDSPDGRRFDELVALIDAWELARERSARGGSVSTR